VWKSFGYSLHVLSMDEEPDVAPNPASSSQARSAATKKRTQAAQTAQLAAARATSAAAGPARAAARLAASLQPLPPVAAGADGAGAAAAAAAAGAAAPAAAAAGSLPPRHPRRASLLSISAPGASGAAAALLPLPAASLLRYPLRRASGAAAGGLPPPNSRAPPSAFDLQRVLKRANSGSGGAAPSRPEGRKKQQAVRDGARQEAGEASLLTGASASGSGSGGGGGGGGGGSGSSSPLVSASSLAPSSHSSPLLPGSVRPLPSADASFHSASASPAASPRAAHAPTVKAFVSKPAYSVATGHQKEGRLRPQIAPQRENRPPITCPALARFQFQTLVLKLVVVLGV
jgi:hypothetical protein